MIAFWPYFLSGSLMIGLALLLGWWIGRKRGVGWGLFAIGAVTFVASQVLHVPFNWLILQQLQVIPTETAVIGNRIILALFLGLSAGVFEETARYLVMRFWAKDVRTWGRGLMLGAGHGGIEAILLGGSLLLNAFVLGTINQGGTSSLVPAEQLTLVETQVEAMLAAPLSLIMLGPLERVFALCAHLAMSLMVMQVFVRRQIGWLGLAILWHTLLNAIAVFAVITWNPYITEALIGIVALLSLGIIFWLRTPEPVVPALEPLPEPGPVGQVTAVNPDTLEKSKYS
jgi:uncharacterized membrane protein YhfC